MPTHQGTTQTDIVIGDGGDSAEQNSSFEFTATYDSSATLDYQDAASGQDDQDSRYELVVKDAAGSTLATLAAKYTAEGVLGSATSINTSKNNTFSPSPSGSSPGWPTSPATSGTREWLVTCTKNGSTFCTHQARWDFVTTVKSGGQVSQVVTSQSDDELVVALSYTQGRNVLAQIEVKCSATVQVSTGVTAGSPSVSDSFSP